MSAEYLSSLHLSPVRLAGKIIFSPVMIIEVFKALKLSHSFQYLNAQFYSGTTDLFSHASVILLTYIHVIAKSKIDSVVTTFCVI